MINLRIVLFFIGILISYLGIAMTLPLLIEVKNSEIECYKLFNLYLANFIFWNKFNSGI